MASLLIENILKTKPITKYLASKGIMPDGHERNGKIFYRCPLHEGDNTPSFVVYTGSGDYENFYCFGCKARYNIIHLYRDLEKVSLGASIKALGEGITVSDDAELTHAINAIQSDNSIQSKFTPDELVLQLSRMLYEFLKWVDYDPECAAACDKMYQTIDKASETCDWESLQTMYDDLQDVLVKRQRLYFEAKDRKERGQ